MPRPVFDPTQATGAQKSLRPQAASVSGSKSTLSAQKPVYSPSVLADAVEDALADGFPGTLQLRGEVSNFRERNHWYFAVKDGGASIACTCWASTARKQPVALEDGLEVVVSGKMAFYGPQGKLQILVSKIEPVGRGALEAELRERADELRNIGYFDEANKSELPLMPESIAVVTSRSAAALQDVIDTARRRWPGVKLALFDVRVQGDQAAGEIAAAINAISEGRAVDDPGAPFRGPGPGRGLSPGAVIVTRGGGSMEDLWAFNERVVCDAVFNCSVPIVAAIGHETDTTLAELCADRRAATPTQAATLLVPERERLAEQLRQTQDRLRLTVTRQVSSRKQQLDAYARHPVFRGPDEQTAVENRRLDALAARLNRVLSARVQSDQAALMQLKRRWQQANDAMAPDREALAALQTRIHRAMASRTLNAQQRLDSLDKRLRAVSPDRVLERGYSYTLGPDGKLLRQTKQAVPGDTLTTVLADGQLQSRVLDENGADVGKPNPPQRPRRKRPTRKPPRGHASEPSGTGGLFD